MANANGRGIGDIDTTTGSDMIGLRCPVGDTKVMEVSTQSTSGVTVGTVALLSNLLIIPYETALASETYVGGYRIPKLNYNIIGASALVAGTKLLYDSVSDAFVAAIAGVNSEIRFTGILLQETSRAEQAIASEAIIEFNGIGEIQLRASDAIARIA